MEENNTSTGLVNELYAVGKGFISDKLSSPLITTFVISWLITNYQAVLIFFADADVNLKLTLLDYHFHKNYYLISENFLIPNWILFGVLTPALVAYIYVYQYPKIGNMFYLKAVDNKQQLEVSQSETEGKLPKTPEQVDTIIKIYTKRIEKAIKRIGELEKTNNAQESVIEELEKQNIHNDYDKTSEPKEPQNSNSAEEVETKIELLKAYIDMEDFEGANELIFEIQREGNESQKRKAKYQQKKIQKLISSMTAKLNVNKPIKLDSKRIEVIKAIGRCSDSGLISSSLEQISSELSVDLPFTEISYLGSELTKTGHLNKLKSLPERYSFSSMGLAYYVNKAWKDS